MRLTLTVFPDGKAILSTPENLTQQTALLIREAWDAWKTGDGHALIIGNTDVVHSTEIELDLREGATK